MTIPNQITFLRIFLIFLFVPIFYWQSDWRNELATAIFIIASLTDLLDGYLARKWHQSSAFGEFLDPAADKLMVVIILVLLVQKYPTTPLALAAIIIIGRELTISSLREWMATVGLRNQVAVSVLGKIKTTMQMTALGFLIYYEPVLGLPTYTIGMVLLYIAVVLTLISMCMYLHAAYIKLKSVNK